MFRKLKQLILFLLCSSIFMYSCKKKEEDKPKQYDECGNEICDNCGGVGMPIHDATVMIYVRDTSFHAIGDPIKIYNADDSSVYKWVYGAMGNELSCSAGSNPNIAYFNVDPGKTFHWAAVNNSYTRTWSDSIRNPNCEDGVDCYSDEIKLN